MRQGRSPRALEGTSRPGEVSSGPSPRVGRSIPSGSKAFQRTKRPPFYSYLLLTLSNPIVEHVGVTSHPSTGSASRIPILVRSGSAALLGRARSAPPSAAWPGMRHRRACGRPVRRAYALVSCSNLFAAHLHATCPATDACRLFGFCAFPRVDPCDRSVQAISAAQLGTAPGGPGPGVRP